MRAMRPYGQTDEEYKAYQLKLRGVKDPELSFASVVDVDGMPPIKRAFQDMMGDKVPPLLLVYGATGNGKSLCCQALVSELYRNNILATRRRWVDVVLELKSLFGQNSEYDRYYKALRESEILVIDDIGNGTTMGDWEWSLLDDIVDYRYENELKTIMTTNFDVKSLPPRIISRFRDKSVSRIVFNQASDYRLKSKGKANDNLPNK